MQMKQIFDKTINERSYQLQSVTIYIAHSAHSTLITLHDVAKRWDTAAWQTQLQNIL